MIVMRWPRPGRLLASQAWVLVTRWAYHDHHEMASAFKLRCKSVSLLRVSLLLVPLLISAPAFQISNQAVARSMRFHIFHGTNSCALYMRAGVTRDWGLHKRFTGVPAEADFNIGFGV